MSSREGGRSEEHTSELQSLRHLVCRLLLEKKNAGRPPPALGHHRHPPYCFLVIFPSECAPRELSVRPPPPLVHHRPPSYCFLFFLNDRGPPELSPLPPHGPFPL